MKKCRECESEAVREWSEILCTSPGVGMKRVVKNACLLDDDDEGRGEGGRWRRGSLHTHTHTTSAVHDDEAMKKKCFKKG